MASKEESIFPIGAKFENFKTLQDFEFGSPKNDQINEMMNKIEQVNLHEKSIGFHFDQKKIISP